MTKQAVPPRLLQIALDGAEARSVEAGTGPLGYRDCAVIVNGIRPVLADLRAQVAALPDDPDLLTSGGSLNGYRDAIAHVLAILNGGSE